MAGRDVDVVVVGGGVMGSAAADPVYVDLRPVGHGSVLAAAMNFVPTHVSSRPAHKVVHRSDV
jgi:hypothetical protein